MIKKLFFCDFKLSVMIKIFLFIALIGCTLLVLVHCLPEERIRNNIAKSIEYMNEEGSYPYMGVKDIGFALDNYTEASLLNFMYTADNEKPLYSAFVQQEYFPKEWNSGVDCLNGAVNELGGEMSGKLSVRSSYWLGYSIFLRPLLFIRDYYDIRSINNVLAMILFAGIAVTMAKKINNYISLAFVTTLCCFNYYVLSLNITLGIFCVYVVYGAIAYILKKEEKINIGYTMLAIGALTAFFEWFSIPYITFGIPVVILLYIKRVNGNRTIIEYFNYLFQSSVSWIGGYGGMIILKPLIASLLTDNSAISSFTSRFLADSIDKTMTIAEFKMSVLQLLRLVFPLHFADDINNRWIVHFIFMLFIIMVLCVFFYKDEIGYWLSLLIISVSPILWCIVFKGHIHHTGIDYRIWMVSLFVFFVMLEKPIKYLYKKISIWYMKRLQKWSKI